MGHARRPMATLAAATAAAAALAAWMLLDGPAGHGRAIRAPAPVASAEEATGAHAGSPPAAPTAGSRGGPAGARPGGAPGAVAPTRRGGAIDASRTAIEAAPGGSDGEFAPAVAEARPPAPTGGSGSADKRAAVILARPEPARDRDAGRAAATAAAEALRGTEERLRAGWLGLLRGAESDRHGDPLLRGIDALLAAEPDHARTGIGRSLADLASRARRARDRLDAALAAVAGRAFAYAPPGPAASAPVVVADSARPPSAWDVFTPLPLRTVKDGERSWPPFVTPDVAALVRDPADACAFHAVSGGGSATWWYESGGDSADFPDDPRKVRTLWEDRVPEPVRSLGLVSSPGTGDRAIQFWHGPARSAYALRIPHLGTALGPVTWAYGTGGGPPVDGWAAPFAAWYDTARARGFGIDAGPAVRASDADRAAILAAEADGDLVRAFDAAGRAAERAPRDPEIALLRARVLRDAAAPLPTTPVLLIAFGEARRAMALDPSMDAAPSLAAEIGMEIEALPWRRTPTDVAAAIVQCCEEAVRLHGDTPPILLRLARARIDEGRTADATALLARAAEALGDALPGWAARALARER